MSKPATTAQRQAAFRKRQDLKGRTIRFDYKVTPDEKQALLKLLHKLRKVK